MTATGHAIIGTVIAAKIGNPALAIPIAAASHVAADYFPHWDPATNRRRKGKERVFKEAAIDVAIGFLLSFFILELIFPYLNLGYAFIIIIASQSLDWLMAPFYFWGIDFPPFVWAYKLQKKIEHRLDKPWGIINQIAILALLVLLAKIF